MPLKDIPDWYIGALCTVEQLSEQPRNWDGYGSLNIQAPATTTGNELLAILSRIGAPAPHIAPLSGGGLQFEWDFAGRGLELEIRTTGEIEFLTISRDGGMLDGDISDPRSQVSVLLDWLMTGEFELTEAYLESRYAISP